MVDALHEWRSARGELGARWQWSDLDYLVKMRSDTSFLADSGLIADWVAFPLRRNPFLCPADVAPSPRRREEQPRRLQPSGAAAKYTPFVPPADLHRIREATRTVFGEGARGRAEANANPRPLSPRVPTGAALLSVTGSRGAGENPSRVRGGSGRRPRRRKMSPPWPPPSLGGLGVQG